MRNYKFINEWLGQRDVRLAAGFAETLRQYAKEYKNINNITLNEVYSRLGCSKQNVSYWETHCDSTQSGRTILRVVRVAKELFILTDDEAEKLANSAGLSLNYEGGNLMEILNYSGKVCDLSSNALISERMLRYYKKNPTKQALMAITLSLNLPLNEQQEILKKYGYCLSESVAADMVAKWFITYQNDEGRKILYKINEVLEDMGLPLLMTRIK